MRPQVLAALAALAIVMNPSESAADQPSNSNKGDDFWFCMPAGCGADPDLHDGAFTDAWLTITADQSTHAVLTGPGPLGPVVWEGDVLGGESVAVAVDPTYSLLHDDAGRVTAKGFHLVSQLPVQAQLSLQFAAGSNAAASSVTSNTKSADSPHPTGRLLRACCWSAISWASTANVALPGGSPTA